MMERTEFSNLAEPWWLLQPEDVDIRIERAREQLATNLEWDRLWYTLQPDVDRFYDFLIPTHQKLFDRLDYLTDLEERVRWLDELVEVTNPASAMPSAQPSGTGPQPPALGARGAAEVAGAADPAKVEAVVDQAISHLSSEVGTEMAQQLGVTTQQIEALAGNAEFQEILREVLENRLSAGGN
jgi:hypothetical protein